MEMLTAIKCVLAGVAAYILVMAIWPPRVISRWALGIYWALVTAYWIVNALGG